ncbi:PAAR domain-containing protein [Scandinavium sp. NPDC088450]|uniref:PAAR domain-containing protein n=1 Tax=Scandinavium sp. NPDC088450 TaxID=3364514 RepID=UPI00384F190A
MPTGHFLRIGDKTSCGGSILSGSPNHSFGGIATARNGDSVSCGKDGKIYHIAGGIPSYSIHGVAAAGTLHSRSTCPCRARFISSFPNASYWVEEEKKVKATPPVAAPLVTAAPAPEPVKADEPVQHAQAAKKHSEAKREPVDAGFCVLPYGAETGAYEPWLFESEPPAGTRELYRSLNGVGKEYKAGSILLVVDPEKQDNEQIAHMKAAKQRIDTALEPLTHQEANFLHKHYATIANFSDIADKGIGLAADPAGKYFENIEKILKEIQDTYKNTYMTRGALIGEQFYVRRSQLFKELERVLKVGFLNKAMKFGEYTKIKNALGLSTSSITHKWNETGISDIEGYATHIERAAKLVEKMRYLGYVGIGFSVLHSLNEIHEACSIGRENECTKKKYTEVGSFTGGMIGSFAGGSAGVGLCSLVLGPETFGVGALACGVVFSVAGGNLGGALGNWGGENTGEWIYNVVEEDK